MKKTFDIETDLQDYIDGLCTPEDARSIALLLQQNAAWKDAYDAMLSMNALLRNDSLMEAPSVRFGKNVMEAIHGQKIARPAGAYINRWLFPVVMGILGVVLLVSLGLLLGSMDWNTGDTYRLGVDLPKADWQALLNPTWVKGFVLANIVVFFYLADRFWTGWRPTSPH